VLAAAVTLGEDDRRSLARVIIGAVIVLLILMFVHPRTSDAAPARQRDQVTRICNPRPPDWPGCTLRQIRPHEAGDEAKGQPSLQPGTLRPVHHEFRMLTKP
jgi:hypothetical protein